MKRIPTLLCTLAAALAFALPMPGGLQVDASIFVDDRTVDLGVDEMSVFYLSGATSGDGGNGNGDCPDPTPGFNCGSSEVDDYTALLFHFDGRGQGGVGTDSYEDCSGSTYSPHNKSWRGNQGVTEEVDSAYFGASGISLVGTDYYELAQDYEFHPRTGAFMIDAWVRIPSSVDANKRTLFALKVAGSDFDLASDGGQLSVYNDAHGWVTPGNADLRDDAWHHWAVGRSGTTLLFFIDGVKTGAVVDWNDDVWEASTAPWAIGYDGANQKFVGDVDELRWSVGICRWDENFDVPTEAY